MRVLGCGVSSQSQAAQAEGAGESSARLEQEV